VKVHKVDDVDDCWLLTNTEYEVLVSNREYLVPQNIVEGLKVTSAIVLNMLESCEPQGKGVKNGRDA
jgi:hypothetical protein